MQCIEQCSARKTYPQLPLHPRRIVATTHIGGGGVVVKRVGRLRLPGILNQAREVGLAQKTQDAINMACVTTTRHNRPVPPSGASRDLQYLRQMSRMRPPAVWLCAPSSSSVTHPGSQIPGPAFVSPNLNATVAPLYPQI
jgi:hypothetical protein